MAKLTAIQLPDGTIVDVADKVSGYITAEEAPVTDVEVNGSSVVTDGVAEVTVPTNVSDLTNDAGYLTTETDPTVPSWAKQSTKPSYTATEVGALPDDTFIPTNVSDLVNDEGYISSETDPTVPLWAKAPTKPAYTASEVGALPASTVIPSATSDLTNDSGFITANDIPEEIEIIDLLPTTTYSDIYTLWSAGKTIILREQDSVAGTSTYYPLLVYDGRNQLFAFHTFEQDPNNGLTWVTQTRSSSDQYWSRGEYVIPQSTDIPTATSDLTNDSGFITVNDVPQEVAFAIYGQTTYTEIYAFSAANKYVVVVDNGKLVPCTISLVGSTVVCSHFENGSEIIYVVTSEGWTSTSTSYATTASLATVATSGSYNDLSNKPTVSNVQIVRWSEENN